MKTHFELASIFMDNMVLQANKPLFFFGKGTIGSLIEIKIIQKYYTFVIESEEFCFELDPIPVIKEPFDVFIQSKDQVVTLTNCLAGDVYLCTGQSNMQYVCKDVINVTYVEVPNLRLYEVPKLPYKHAEKEFDWLYTNHPKWKVSTIENEKDFSAIGYMIGRDIVQKHDIPVGIISCNMGDTSIYSWLEKSVIENNQTLKPYLDNYRLWEKEYKDYEAFSAVYNERVPKLMEFWGLLDKYRDEGYSSEEVYRLAYEKIPNPYLPMGPKNQNRPSGCYDTMLQTIVPFTNNGIIYYQGENDVSRADEYQVAIKELIKSWRKSFKDNLLFINCQIAGHLYSETPSFEVARLREAQASIFYPEKKQYVTTAVDYGEASNIHPVNKTEVAKRMFYILDEVIYKTSKNSMSPIIDGYEKDGDRLMIKTMYNSLPLINKGKMQDSFVGIDELGNETNITDITLDKTSIIIRNTFNLKEIRYAYSAYPTLSIYTENGLPLLPFRLIIK